MNKLFHNSEKYIYLHKHSKINVNSLCRTFADALYQRMKKTVPLVGIIMLDFLSSECLPPGSVHNSHIQCICVGAAAPDPGGAASHANAPRTGHLETVGTRT